jgi:hypothetical protein
MKSWDSFFLPYLLIFILLRLAESSEHCICGSLKKILLLEASEVIIITFEPVCVSLAFLRLPKSRIKIWFFEIT